MKISNLLENLDNFISEARTKNIDDELKQILSLIKRKENINLEYFANSIINNFETLRSVFSYNVEETVKFIKGMSVDRETFVNAIMKLFEKSNHELNFIKINDTIKIKLDRQEYGDNKSIIIDDYFFKGLSVCKTKKYHEMYCKIVNGRPENLRTIRKNAYSTSWDIVNIMKLFGIPVDMDYFKSEFPDTTYGYTGARLSKKDITISIQSFIENSFNEIRKQI